MLPLYDECRIDRDKIVDYLLSVSHPDGRTKAAFFMRFGFSADKWEVLAAALRTLAVTNPITDVVESEYGKRYTVDGLLDAPDGRKPMIRTVWIVETDTSPRLITAYPL